MTKTPPLANYARDAQLLKRGILALPSAAPVLETKSEILVRSNAAPDISEFTENPPQRPAVTLCVPFEETCYSKWVIPMFHFLLQGTRFNDSLVTQEGAFIDTARNKLVEMALDTSGEYFYMVDSDNPPPPTTLDRLISHREKIVGGWYRVKNGARHPCVYSYAGQDPETKYHNYTPYPEAPSDDTPDAPKCICGKAHAPILQEVDAIGFGCMLIHRSVFETIANYETRWFSTDEGGTEDLYFCRLAKKYGFKVNVDWLVHVGHIGTFVV